LAAEKEKQREEEKAKLE